MNREDLARKIEDQIQRTGKARISISELWEALKQPLDNNLLGAVQIFTFDHGWYAVLSDNGEVFTFFPYENVLTGGVRFTD